MRRLTARRACACQDGAAGDVGAHADEAVVALALSKSRLVAVAVHSRHSHRQVLKQHLHTQRIQQGWWTILRDVFTESYTDVEVVLRAQERELYVGSTDKLATSTHALQLPPGHQTLHTTTTCVVGLLWVR